MVEGVEVVVVGHVVRDDLGVHQVALALLADLVQSLRGKEEKEKEVGAEEVLAVPGSDDFKVKKILLKFCPEKKQTGKLLFMKSPHTQWEKECERSEISTDAAVAEFQRRRCFDFRLEDVQFNSNRKPCAAANSLS